MDIDLTVNQLEYQYAQLKEKYAELLIKSDYMGQYYTAMVYGSLFAYEIDATKNKIISFPDVLKSFYKVKEGSSYNALIKMICDTMIEEEDKEIVYNTVCQESILKAYEQGQKRISIDYLSKSNVNKVSWYRNRLYLLQHPVSGNVHAVITISDIQQQKLDELKLQKRATVDPLTQLANRTFLEEQVATTLQNEHKNHCAILLDIDNFKGINDTFGHQAGDAVLTSFAKMLKGKFRTDDTVARLGGDEFFVFMKNANPAIIYPRAQSILEACKTLMPEDSGIKVTPSIGISIYPDHGESFTDLYKNADIALYHSKKKGKNTYTIYNQNLTKTDEDSHK